MPRVCRCGVAGQHCSQRTGKSSEQVTAGGCDSLSTRTDNRRLHELDSVKHEGWRSSPGQPLLLDLNKQLSVSQPLQLPDNSSRAQSHRPPACSFSCSLALPNQWWGYIAPSTRGQQSRTRRRQPEGSVRCGSTVSGLCHSPLPQADSRSALSVEDCLPAGAKTAESRQCGIAPMWYRAVERVCLPCKRDARGRVRGRSPSCPNEYRGC